MPNNWKTYSVEELIKEEIIYKPLDGNHGETHPKGSDFIKSGIPFIMATDIINGKVDITNCKFISKEQADKLRKGFSKTDDVLITHKASIGRTAVVPQIKSDYIMLTPQVTYYRVRDREKLDFNYLKYFFNSPTFQNEINTRAGSGSTRAYIGITDQLKLKVSFPLIKEQKAIAQILSTIDDKIENNLAINKTLEEMAMALYKHWFVDFGPFQDDEFVDSELGRIPEGWEVKKLGKIYINHNKKRKPISTNERAKIQGDFPYYGATKILDYINHFNFEGEYVLLAEDGTVKTERDSPFLQFVTGKFCVSNHAHVLSGNKDYSNEFLYLSLSNSNVIPIITGAVQLKINKENLEKLQFIVPPKEMLKDFEDKIIPLYKKIKENELENQSLTQLRDTLLPKLISGEVRLKEFRES